MTAYSSAKKMILEWFERNSLCGLVLPDGWFGRPYDNQHRLSYLEARPHKLILELDDQLMLIFTEPKTTRVERADLIIGDFGQCTFDWQEYGSLVPHATIYHTGVVRLVRLM